MSRTYDIAISLSGKLAGTFSRSMLNANRNLSMLQDNITKLETAQGDVTRFRSLHREIDQTKIKLQQAEQELNQLGREMGATDRPSQALIRRFNEAETRAEALKRQLREQRTELRSVSQSMNQAGISTRNLTQDQAALEKRLESVRNAQRRLQQTQAAIADNQDRRADLRGQLVDAAAIGLALAAPIRTAVAFESTMADVNKVLDLSQTEFSATRKQILDMSSRMPMAASQIGAIMTSAGQSGVARHELQQFTETAIKMGVAFDIAGDQAGQMLANWRAGMKLSQGEAEALADTVNYLSNNLNATAPAIGQVIQRMGAVAMTAGLTEMQVAGLSAALLSSGASPEIAGTALKNLTAALTRGEAATKAQKEAFTELGFSATELSERMQEDAEGTIRDVFQALSELPEAMRPGLLSEIFGQESVGAIAPLLSNLEQLDKAFALASDTGSQAGSMLKEYQTRSKTTAHQIQLMQNNMTRLGITVGSVLLPPLTQLMIGASTLAQNLASVAEEFPVLTKWLVMGAAGLMALKVATIASAYAWTFLKGGFLQAVKIMTLVRNAVLLLNGAMLANPIGLVIAGVVALVAAGYLLIKNWDAVKAAAGASWDWIKQKTSSAFEFIKNIFMNFTPAGWMLQGFQAAYELLSNIDWSQSGAKIIDTLIAGIKSKAMDLVNNVKGMFSQVRDYLPFSDAKVGPLSQLTENGRKIVETIGQGVDQANPQAITGPLASKMGGVGTGSGGGMGGMNITYAPQITVSGGQPGQVRREAEQALVEGNRDLVARMRQAWEDQQRLSYG